MRAQAHHIKRPWQWLYDTGRWRQLRKQHLASEPLCRMCLLENRVVAATVVDHIVPHKGNVELFYSGPFQSLCKPCHDGHKQALERSGRIKPTIGPDGWPVSWPADDRRDIGLGDLAHPSWFKPVRVPLTIVCGPPASGKSTYVEQHKGPTDQVFDLDAIALTAYGKRVALLGKDDRLACLKIRNQELSRLMTDEATGSCDMAWLIVSEPDARKRQWWDDTLRPRSMVVLETPADECIARTKADVMQARPADVDRSIRSWWATYMRRESECIVTL